MYVDHTGARLSLGKAGIIAGFSLAGIFTNIDVDLMGEFNWIVANSLTFTTRKERIGDSLHRKMQLMTFNLMLLRVP